MPRSRLIKRKKNRLRGAPPCNLPLEGVAVDGVMTVMWTCVQQRRDRQPFDLRLQFVVLYYRYVLVILFQESPIIFPIDFSNLIAILSLLLNIALWRSRIVLLDIFQLYNMTENTACNILKIKPSVLWKQKEYSHAIQFKYADKELIEKASMIIVLVGTR